MIKKQKIVCDYEVVGLGAKRRQDLIASQISSQYVLKKHAISFMPGLWEETLDWLRPVEVIAGGDFDQKAALLKVFKPIFRQAEKKLGTSEFASLHQDYLQEMPWREGLIFDHYRYFAFFLQQRFPQRLDLIQATSWDWTQFWLQYADFPFGKKSSRQQYLQINPGLVTLRMIQGASLVGIEQGLYAFCYQRHRNDVFWRTLTSIEAEILDELAEDRFFNREQLIETLLLDGHKDASEIASSLDRLKQDQFIF